MSGSAFAQTTNGKASATGVAKTIKSESKSATLMLAKNGKANATIVIPKFADPKGPECEYTKMAAEWLHDYLHRVTGADFPMAEEDGRVSGVVISVGTTKLASQNGFDYSREKWNTCTATVKNGTLFLLGHDEFGPNNNPSEKETFLGGKGTCKAVAFFLEKELGVRWYMPGPMGVKIPKKPTLQIPGNLTLRFEPVFAYENGRNIYGDKHDVATYANNNVTSIVMKTYGGHSWNKWISAKEYFDTHPEYFRLDENGKRNRDSLCTSNPEVREILLREIRKRFDQGYDWVQLGQADGWIPCRCEKCQALDDYWTRNECEQKGVHYTEHLQEHPAERIHQLHKYIIDECAKSHPNKIVHLLVYSPTIWPSKQFDRYGDNVVGEVCFFYEDTLPVWAPKCKGATVYLYWFGEYNVGGIAPTISLDQIASQLKLFEKNKVLGLYLCGAPDKLGLMGPELYATAKLLENPQADPWPLVEEFCQFIYGNAGNTMFQFHRKLDACGAQCPMFPAIKKTEWDDNAAMAVFPRMFPTETLVELERLLTQAESEAADERSRGFLRAVRGPFNFVKFSAEMFHAYATLRESKPTGRETVTALHNAIDRWESERQSFLKLQETNEKFIAAYYGKSAYTAIARYLNTGPNNRKGAVIRLKDAVLKPTQWLFASMEDKTKDLSKVDDVDKLLFREDFEDSKSSPSSNPPGASVEIAEGGPSGKCLHIHGTQDNNDLFSFKKTAPIEECKHCRITLWIQVDKFLAQDHAGQCDLTFGVTFDSKSKKAPQFSTPYFPALGGWQQLVIDDIVIPENTTSFKINLQSSPSVRGTPTEIDVRLDSLRVVKLKKKR
jgi:hypothetical protein